jgi:hypothetical protein
MTTAEPSMGIFRKMFGPSKEEVWRQLASEIGGNMIERRWQGSKVEARVDEWTVTLDSYMVPAGKAHLPVTRLRAPFVNADNFRFRISRRNLLSGLAHFLGGQDIEIGDPAFDHDFVIKSNDALKVKYLLNAELRELIREQPEITFSIKDDDGAFRSRFPDGVDQLTFEAMGLITDVDRLKSLFDLFARTLHQLCHIGSAYESDPRIELR